MSGEQVEGEVEGGFGLKWWWWFLGGKGTGWYWWSGVDRALTQWVGWYNFGLRVRVSGLGL